jgi:type VI secretion system protein ImpM
MQVSKVNNHSPAIDQISSIGYYGKIPNKGDFISKNLPRSFTEPWHRWAKEAMACSRDQLKQTWEECYLTTPLYQYILSPGICGSTLWIGVMMPSVDKVGRYYPMTLCRSVSSLANPFTLFEKHQLWFRQSERLLLSCLDDDFSLHHFDAALSQCTENEAMSKNNENENMNQDSNTITMQQFTLHNYADSAWQMPMVNNNTQNGLYPMLLNSMASTFLGAYSLWRTQGSAVISPSMVMSEGLPPYNSVAAFMDGNWQKWGWNAEHILQS